MWKKHASLRHASLKFKLSGTAGLHIGNDSRGGKIRFYESKEGNGVKIRVCKDPCV